MRRDIPLFLGLAAVPVITLAQSQPPPLPEEPVQNDAWANAAEVSNQLDDPSFDQQVNNTLPPAKEIERPKF